jgi:ABC-type glucose/galactose transport system permease subunit
MKITSKHCFTISVLFAIIGMVFGIIAENIILTVISTGLLFIGLHKLVECEQ